MKLSQIRVDSVAGSPQINSGLETIECRRGERNVEAEPFLCAFYAFET